MSVGVLERSTIVSIYGPTGSGKSQLAKAVSIAVDEDRCTRIPTDYFANFAAAASTDASGLLTGTLTYDWVRLDEVLDQPLGTIVTTPDVDFERLVRRSPDGGLAFVVRQIMLTDAFPPHPSASIRIRLTAPESTRRNRVIERDTRWGSRVIDRWQHLEATWDDVAGKSGAPDLDLSGEDPIGVNAARIAAVIRRTIDGTPYCR